MHLNFGSVNKKNVQYFHLEELIVVVSSGFFFSPENTNTHAKGKRNKMLRWW